MTIRFPSRVALILLLSLVPAVAVAAPAEPAPAPVPDADTTNGVAPIRPVQSGPLAGAEAQRYCQNIAAAAAEARAAWESKKLVELQTQVADKITALEAKTAELKDVLARRDEALKRADTALVAIYAKMKPDTAAAQLSALDDEMAAAVLAQLNPRAASAILNEVSPDRAARFVNAIVGAQASDGKKS